MRETSVNLGSSEKHGKQALKQYYINMLICLVGFFYLANNSDEDTKKNKKAMDLKECILFYQNTLSQN